ncbi:Uma2 family endonuclease [Pleomorphovibrio marinus]|uniref:Uma2 family endonuclease n=1 Tax=Pleomorphovibrio marinus TaxID=2164132 RepID=UPI000E0A3CE3|nr:Uma2 family endonuclease [Pleomorphovibrio marinus]
MKSVEKKSSNQNKLEEPFTEYGVYSYADYLTWQLDDMVELIKGKVFKSAAAAPRRVHQKISGRILIKLGTYLNNNACEVYAAPFDVRLPGKSTKNEDVFTVIQPDLCVICDKSKLDEFGCIGAPDLIMEILSPGSNKKELQNKYEVYEESGVKEYWVIHPNERTLLIYTLGNANYVPSKLFTFGDSVASTCIPGFELDLEDIFSDLD